MVHEYANEITNRAGVPIEIRRIVVRDLDKSRHALAAAELFSTEPDDVVGAGDIDVVVELMGGVEQAGAYIRKALANGKHVITANKELLSVHGAELLRIASAAGLDLRFEGAVGGGIPIIRPLQDSLAGERITRVIGIVNGTTNYILTKMTDHGYDLDVALSEAQALGFAESDPSADIQGADAAAKLSILATIAFDTSVKGSDVYRQGIVGVGPRELQLAASLGYVIKLLAIAEAMDGRLSVKVHPTMVPETHPLAAVRDNLNAVFVEGKEAGELMFYGRGAGGPPTAVAVLGDLVSIARDIISGRPAPGWSVNDSGTELVPIDETTSQYFILLEVVDRRGVLAQVAGVFADHDVSIKSVWQEGFGDEATLVLVTHRASERDFQRMLKDLSALEVVEEVASWMRVLGEG